MAGDPSTQARRPAPRRRAPHPSVPHAPPEAPLNLEIHVRRPGGSALARDYLTGEGSARRFFPWRWDDPDELRARARRVAERFTRDQRERVAAMLDAPVAGGGAGGTPRAGEAGESAAEGAERLERWVEEGGLLVTTGQQPGLFTGPLYSVYKGLSAVRLARWLEEELDVPVLPVFWIASEDHDWEEAHDTWLVGVDNELHQVALPDPPPEERDQPLHRIRAHLEEAVGAFLAHLPETDFSPDAVALLRSCWEGGRVTLPAAFGCTLRGLLGRFGLHFVDAHNPALKTASRDVLRRELRGAEAHEERLARRAAELEEAGYHVQVPVLEGGVNLFVEGPAGRERLYRDAEGFHLRHSGTRLAREEVERRIEEETATVSPNVLLRPVVETAVLPTVAYVAGPGEIAYFAQLGPLFEAHDLPAPVVVPRHSVTLIESKIRKVLDKFGLEPGALDRPFHELAGEIAREELPAEVQAALGRLKGAIGEGTAELTEAARAVDPTLKGPISHARSVAFDAVGEAEKKIVQAVKRENEIALQQLEKAQLHLHPGGKPQERVVNVFYYLVRYGDGFLDQLLQRFDPTLPYVDPAR